MLQVPAVHRDSLTHSLAVLPTNWTRRYTWYTHPAHAVHPSEQVRPPPARHCQTAPEPQSLLFVLPKHKGDKASTPALRAPAWELCVGCTDRRIYFYSTVPAARFPSTATTTLPHSLHIQLTDSIKNLPPGSSAKTPLAIPLALPSSPRIGYHPLELPVGKATPVGFWIPLTNDFS